MPAQIGLEERLMTAEAIYAWVKTAPNMRIAAGSSPPWDLVSFYLLHPKFYRFKAKKLTMHYPHLLYWQEGVNSGVPGEIDYICAVLPTENK